MADKPRKPNRSSKQGSNLKSSQELGLYADNPKKANKLVIGFVASREDEPEDGAGADDVQAVHSAFDDDNNNGVSFVSKPPEDGSPQPISQPKNTAGAVKIKSRYESDLVPQKNFLSLPSQTLPKTPVENNISVLLAAFHSAIQTPENMSPWDNLVRSSHVVSKPNQYYDASTNLYVAFDYTSILEKIRESIEKGFTSYSNSIDQSFLIAVVKASLEFALMYQRSLLSPTVGSLISMATKGSGTIESATKYLWNPVYWFLPVYYSICLPQNEQNMAERHRILEITQIQYNYTQRARFGGYFGKPLLGGPPMFNHVPPSKDLLLMSDSQSLQTALGYTINFIRTSVVTQVKKTISEVYSKSEWTHLEDYANALKPFFNQGKVTIPLIVNNYRNNQFNKDWLSDEEFCRQRLQGMNPEKIEKIQSQQQWQTYKRMLNWTPVVDDRVKVMCGGKTIEQAVDAGLIYVVDYSIFADDELRVMAKCNNRFIAAPITLFYLNGSQLNVLGIQLWPEGSSKPGESQRQFHMPKKLDTDPNIDHPAWILCKLWVNSMDGQYQELVPHLLECHQISEILCVTMFRNLGVNHPIHKLLRSHFEATVEVNGVAYNDLLAKEGAISTVIGAGSIGGARLIGKVWQKWSFYETSFKRSLIRRGFLDEKGNRTDSIDRYCWRTYGLALWDIINTFVKKILDKYYITDNDVVEDWEIQTFMDELQDPHYGNIRQATSNGKLETKDQLYTFITDVIFIVTGKHSAGNSGQFDYYGFVPNVPAGMYIDCHVNERLTTWDTIMEAIPNKDAALAQMAITYLLSQVNTDALPLIGNAVYPDEWKNEAAQFKKALEGLSQVIDDAEKDQIYPYTYLDPRRIGNSVYI